MFINFSDIPGHNNLFLDYLNEFDNVDQFYEINFRKFESYEDKFRAVASSERYAGKELSEIIENQYKGFSLSKKTSENISLLGKKNTLAIVTGQQLGILGGPLYTFYKIITAIKLSEHLNHKFSEFTFVPVFWLEGDDHDYDEIRSISLLSPDNKLSQISYNDGLSEEVNRGDTGSIVINSNIDNFFNELNINLRDSDFKSQILDLLKSCYSEGKTFKQAMKELIFNFYDKHGLVIFDPQDEKIKKHLIPIFQKEIKDFRFHTEKVVEVSAKLEELYHVQVKVRPINLFRTEEDGRHLIEPVENEFRLKRKRKKISEEELLKLIENEPEKFSPNVLLRPICQDAILPTAIYVGGPSEISYFAQVLPLYEFYGFEPPIIYPRSSLTILEKSTTSVFEKYNLTLQDFYFPIEEISDKVIKALSTVSFEESFVKAENSINIILNELKNELLLIDKPTGESTDRTKQKLLNYLEELKNKTGDALKRKHETSLRQIERTSVSVFPNQSLQERVFTLFYFCNKYGLDFIDKIYDVIEINKFEHQTWEL